MLTDEFPLLFVRCSVECNISDIDVTKTAEAKQMIQKQK